MARFVKNPYLWGVTALVILQVFNFYLHFSKQAGWFMHFHDEWALSFMTLVHVLFLAGVASATWRFGVYAGMATCLSTGTLFILSALEMAEHSGTGDVLPGNLLVFTVGILLIWLIHVRAKRGRLVKQANERLLQELTERNRMQEQLAVSDRLASIGQLTSGIAHELNNPLTSVIGFSELLMEKDLPKDVKEDLDTINREAKRTASVVKGLLTFARKQGTEKTLVDINSIIQGVLQLRSYEHRVSNIEVNERFSSDLPQVLGNGAQLQQVFINIIINAEQAMLEAHGRGKLTIGTKRVGDIVRASVADDGPGISPENIRKLFTPFFTTKEVGKGTGLGLSICHGIVTEHGGKIYAESELGKGATFVLELPVR